MKKFRFFSIILLAFVFMFIPFVSAGCKKEEVKAPTVEINEDGYWVINGEVTNVKANGQNGQDGKDGEDGADAPVVYIAADGYWYIDGVSTGVKATGGNGENGKTPYIQDGYWYIDGVSTGVKAEAQNGQTPAIINGYWYIGTTSTGVRAEAQDGKTPYIQDNYWYIDGESTGIKATPENGVNGKTPYIQDGYWYIDGVSTNVKATGDNGSDGKTPYIQDGYWYIDGISTNVKATGNDGNNGSNGKTPYIQDGYWYIDGVSTNVKAEGVDASYLTYTITYDYDGATSLFKTTDESQTIQTNQWLTTLPEIKDEYKDVFIGWYIEGTDIQIKNYMFIGGNVTLVAKFDNLYYINNVLTLTNHQTMQDVIDYLSENNVDLFAFDKSLEESDRIVIWDSVNNILAYVNTNNNNAYYLSTHQPTKAVSIENTFMILHADEQSISSNQLSLYYPCSVYLAENSNLNGVTINTNKGVDVGVNAHISAINYTNNSGIAQNVIIRTSGGTLTIDAELDTVNHYGDAEVLVVEKIAGSSCHIYGVIKERAIINQGHLEIKETGSVPKVFVEEATGNVVVTANAATFITVDEDSSAATTVVVKSEEVFVSDEAGNVTLNEENNHSAITKTLINNQEELTAALTADTPAQYIKINADFNITDTNSISANTVLDLNGHVLTNDAVSTAFTVKSDYSLTIQDTVGEGEIESNYKASTNINVSSNATLTIESGKLTNTHTNANSVCVKSYGTIYMKGGELNSYVKCFTLYGGEVIISGGKSTSESSVPVHIVTSSTRVTISGDAEITAKNSRAISASYLVVEGNPIIKGHTEAIYTNSTAGFVEIKGGTIIGETKNAILIGSSPLKITGGTLVSAQDYADIDFGNRTQSGYGYGYVTIDSGEEYISNTNYSAVVLDGNNQILGYFSGLHACEAELSIGNTVKLTSDIILTGEESVFVSKATTLDLNGHTIYHQGNETKSATAITIKNTAIDSKTPGTFIITGEGTVRATDISGAADKGANAVQVNCSKKFEVIIEGGNYYVDGDNQNATIYIMKSSVTGSVVKIMGGTYGVSTVNNYYLLNMLDSMREKAQIVVYEGTFVGYNPAENGSGENEVVLDENSTSNENDNVWIVTVVE